MSKTIPRYHVLHRSGYVGEDAPQEILLPPGVNAGAERPAHGDCSNYEETHDILLPAMFHTGSSARPGQAMQDGYGYGDDILLPPGVS